RQTFYRPVGGGIHFGESSSAAVHREVREEIGADISELRYIGTLENIFTHDGAAGHEIVQVYDGRFVNASLYSLASLPGVESNGQPFRAIWKPLDTFTAERPLYPDGLLELLRSASVDCAP
ncbi:MAG: NUDIX hydrolase, partial [Burkholderiales bacterium]